MFSSRPAGWGIRQSSNEEQTLTFASVRVNQPAVCNKRLRKLQYGPAETYNAKVEWCASVGDSTAICVGDSGSPMFTLRRPKGRKGKPTVVVHGIMSVRTGRSCVSLNVGVLVCCSALYRRAPAVELRNRSGCGAPL